MYLYPVYLYPVGYLDRELYILRQLLLIRKGMLTFCMLAPCFQKKRKEWINGTIFAKKKKKACIICSRNFPVQLGALFTWLFPLALQFLMFYCQLILVNCMDSYTCWEKVKGIWEVARKMGLRTNLDLFEMYFRVNSEGSGHWKCECLEGICSIRCLLTN